MKPQGIRDEILRIISGELQKILIQNQKMSVSVFGSRARGDFKPYSDIDLLLDAEPPLTDSQMDSLRESLEENENIPFKFDLVRLQEIHPPYKAQMLREKKVWIELKR